MHGRAHCSLHSFLRPATESQFARVHQIKTALLPRGQGKGSLASLHTHLQISHMLLSLHAQPARQAPESMLVRGHRTKALPCMAKFQEAGGTEEPRLDCTPIQSPPGTGPAGAAAQAFASECRGDQETAGGTPCAQPSCAGTQRQGCQ